jgi:hypothetical protein
MSDKQAAEVWLNKFLDTFFHLPTLITVALVALLLFWQLADIGVYLGQGFMRLNTNQGNLTLEWRDGCCSLDW